jgi:tRNA(adenine34) deaminase
MIQLDNRTDDFYMREALKEAQKAFDMDEIPVGAIIVLQGNIIARAHNQVELLKDSTAHAEMLALTSAYASLGAKYLPEATLYVTLEPCLMCAGALRWGKLPRIVYGASDARNGCNSFVNKSPYHEKATVLQGILEPECAQLMKDFFVQRR